MNTKLQALVTDNDAVIGCSFDRVHSEKAYEVSTVLSGAEAVNDTKIYEAPKKERSIVKTTGLFLAAPFIALAYVIALPVVGFYMFAKLGYEAYQKKKSSS